MGDVPGIPKASPPPVAIARPSPGPAPVPGGAPPASAGTAPSPPAGTAPPAVKIPVPQVPTAPVKDPGAQLPSLPTDVPALAELPSIAGELQASEFQQAEHKLDVQSQVLGDRPQLGLSVRDLLPDLKFLTNPDQLPEQFASDLALLQAQVLGPPQAPPQVAANRLFQFFAAFAARYVELAQGLPPGAELDTALRAFRTSGLDAGAAIPLVQGDLQAGAADRFLAMLADLGFQNLHELAMGKDGLALAAQLLGLRSPEELLQLAARATLTPDGNFRLPREALQPFVPAVAAKEGGANFEAKPADERAPERRADGSAFVEPRHEAQASRPEASVARLQREDPAAAASRPEASGSPERVARQAEGNGRGPLLAASERERSDEPRNFADVLSGTSKRLGPRMLWNALHTLRKPNPQEDETTRRDRWNRLMISAVLVLAGILAVVVVLVNL